LILSYPKQYARAYVFNKIITEKNPWINHLRKTGTYEAISSELLNEKISYIKNHKNLGLCQSQQHKQEERKREKASHLINAINQYKKELIKELVKK